MNRKKVIPVSGALCTYLEYCMTFKHRNISKEGYEWAILFYFKFSLTIRVIFCQTLLYFRKFKTAVKVEQKTFELQNKIAILVTAISYTAAKIRGCIKTWNHRI